MRIRILIKKPGLFVNTGQFSNPWIPGPHTYMDPDPRQPNQQAIDTILDLWRVLLNIKIFTKK